MNTYQLNAKAILDRDLTAVRAKRAERENAIRTEKLKAAGKQALQETANTEKESNQKDVRNKQEVATTASSLASNVDGKKKANLDNGVRANSDIRESNPSGKEDTSEDVNTIAIADQTPNEIKDLGVAGDIFGGGLGTSSFANIAADADFDSMFNDPGENGTASLDFNLDFSNPNPTGDGLSTSNTGGPLGSLAEVGNLEATSSEDINSVLPGLENYLDADGDGGLGDFSMLDVPVADGNLVGAAVAGPRPGFNMTENVSQANPTSEPTTIDAEANFDDLLFGSDTLDMGSVGNIDNGDFDDFFAT